MYKLEKNFPSYAFDQNSIRDPNPPYYPDFVRIKETIENTISK